MDITDNEHKYDCKSALNQCFDILVPLGYIDATLDQSTEAINIPFQKIKSNSMISECIHDLNKNIEEDLIETIVSPQNTNTMMTENLANVASNLLNKNLDNEVHELCSNFNDIANLQTNGSVYSDETTSLLTYKLDTNTKLGTHGLEANVQVDGSISEHNIGDIDVNIGHGRAYAQANIGFNTMKAVIGGELNAISLEKDNIQINIGLSAKTGINLSEDHISASMVGFGFSIGADGVGINTPIGGVNLEPRKPSS